MTPLISIEPVEKTIISNQKEISVLKTENTELYNRVKELESANISSLREEEYENRIKALENQNAELLNRTNGNEDDSDQTTAQWSNMVQADLYQSEKEDEEFQKLAQFLKDSMEQDEPEWLRKENQESLNNYRLRGQRADEKLARLRQNKDGAKAFSTTDSSE